MNGGAARLWWLLRHFGHDDVAVLAGGIGVWRGPLRSGERRRIDAREFVPRPRADDAITAEVAGRLGRMASSSSTRERLSGTAERRSRSTPSPATSLGARNLPYTEGADVPEDLIGTEDEVVVYCGSGITACVDILALERAGVHAKLYPGSWSEWSSRGLPVERG